MPQSLPLRTAEERLEFCERYFESVSAPCTYQSPMYREYTLPRDVDKELTDRPFYWMWIEKTNQEHKPTTLRLAFTQQAVERENQRLRDEALKAREGLQLNEYERMFFRPPTCEFVTLGSFRLDKLYESVDARGEFACVAPRNRKQVPLVPWLMINALISYRCDLIEQEFVSVGVCLTNGQVVERFFDMVQKIDMESVPPLELLSRASLSLPQGFERVERFLTTRLINRPTEWATDATERMNKEVRQIRMYYQSILPDIPEDEKPLIESELRRKERDLIEKMEPKIEIEYCQMSIVALIEK